MDAENDPLVHPDIRWDEHMLLRHFRAASTKNKQLIINFARWAHNEDRKPTGAIVRPIDLKKDGRGY